MPILTGVGSPSLVGGMDSDLSLSDEGGVMSSASLNDRCELCTGDELKRHRSFYGNNHIVMSSASLNDRWQLCTSDKL